MCGKEITSDISLVVEELCIVPFRWLKKTGESSLALSRRRIPSPSSSIHGIAGGLQGGGWISSSSSGHRRRMTITIWCRIWYLCGKFQLSCDRQVSRRRGGLSQTTCLDEKSDAQIHGIFRISFSLDHTTNLQSKVCFSSSD